MTEVDGLIQMQLLREIWNVASSFRDLMATIGLLYTSKCMVFFVWRLFRVIRVYVVPKVWYSSDFRHYGSWAVVTGCSEGIGRSYALKLADRKMNVFLISRDEEKLKILANQIREKGVSAEYLAMDLRYLGLADCMQTLERCLSALDIGVLVNNVGVMYDQLQYFLSVSQDRILAILDLNIKATVLMTRIVLPGMVARGKGAIINVSSGSSIKPTPLMSHYSASKAFVDKFSRALEYEYRTSNITIQAVQPFYVSTKMTGYGDVNWLMQSPDDYVENAIRTLGVTRRCYGTMVHGLFGFLGEILPERIYMFSALYLNQYLWSWICRRRMIVEKSK